MHLPRKWIDRRFYEYFSTNVTPIFARHKTPVLVYQMGKVGSSSLRNSLFRSPAPETDLVLMSHEFFPIRNRVLDKLAIGEKERDAVLREIQHDRHVFNQFSFRKKIAWRLREKFYTEKIYNNYVRMGRPLKVITLVREPIANNISMFFQILDHYTGEKHEKANWTTDRLIQLFLDRYIHTRPLTWFDAELRPMLGIDVYEYAYPKDRGHLSIEKDNIELLVLKCELSNREKESAVKAFLGIDEFKIIPGNLSSGKLYAQQYKEFRSRIIFPESLLDEVYGSRYALHFYDEADLVRFHAHWSRLDSRANAQ